MNIQTNHSLSVDCVVFGYDAEGLKVLLVEQRALDGADRKSLKLKLPGRMIYENETLEGAAKSLLGHYTGLESVYLKQTSIFSDPRRVSEDELKWISEYHKIKTDRVVTVGYYSLVPITLRVKRNATIKGGRWKLVSSVKELAMDHLNILRNALEVMRNDFSYSPVAFKLLPNKFTLSDLQNLYSAILGVRYDNRNFRKKILSLGIVRPTGEKQKGVAHKPAEFYTFSLTAYKKMKEAYIKNII